MHPLKDLNILACPLCKGRLNASPEGSALLCSCCNLAFPVKGGIPLLLVDAAEKMTDEHTE